MKKENVEPPKNIGGSRTDGQVDLKETKKMILIVSIVVITIIIVLFTTKVVQNRNNDSSISSSIIKQGVQKDLANQHTPPPTINYPTEKNPTVVRVGVGESAHIIPFEIPDNMDLVIQSWNKENFVYREVDDTVPVVVTPGITISQAKHLRIVIKSGIGRPMYVQYYLEPKV